MTARWPGTVFDRFLRIARHRGFRGTEAEFHQILVHAFGHAPRSALMRHRMEPQPLLPSEQIVHRRQVLPFTLRVQLAWCATLERHGRARYRATCARETSWENAIFYRFHHPRGGPVWMRSPPRVLRSYRKDRLRWLRLSRDRSLSPGARRYARRMVTGARQNSLHAASHEAWDAFHARSKNQRSDPRVYVAWLAERLAKEAA